MNLGPGHNWRRVWNRHAGAILGQQDQPEFAAALVAGLRALVGFEHSAIFGYPPGRRPVFLFDGFSSEHQRSAITPYLRGTYLVDPFFDACRRGVAPGLYRMEDLAPDEFFAAVGAHPGYVSPCVSEEPGVLSEEIGFFARTPGDAYVVLSLMRPRQHPPFSETEMEILREVEPFVRNAMAQRWAGLGQGAAPGGGPCVGGLVEAAFAALGREVLTERERQVARLILDGHSTASVAGRLGIAPNTVKIHRKNLYAKLGIATQSELFALFIRTLSAP